MRGTPCQASPTIASALRPAECQVSVVKENELSVWMPSPGLGSFLPNQHPEWEPVLDFQRFNMAVTDLIEMLEHLDNL